MNTNKLQNLIYNLEDLILDLKEEYDEDNNNIKDLKRIAKRLQKDLDNKIDYRLDENNL